MDGGVWLDVSVVEVGVWLGGVESQLVNYELVASADAATSSLLLDPVVKLSSEVPGNGENTIGASPSSSPKYLSPSTLLLRNRRA